MWLKTKPRYTIMTYCLGIKVRNGLVAIADTRITAGNEVYSNKKISQHTVSGKPVFIMTSGLRSVRDKALIYFKHLIEDGEKQYQYMYEVANALGEMIRKVAAEDRASLKAEGYAFNLHAIVGGQMASDDEHRMFMVFPEGNWVEINEGLRFSVIGNVSYGKPLVYRLLSYESSLEEALKIAFLSFDDTRLNANDVGYPLDVIIYKKDSFEMTEHRITKEQVRHVSEAWENHLKDALGQIPNDWTREVFEK